MTVLEEPLSLEVCRNGWCDAPDAFKERILRLFPHMVNGVETNFPPHLIEFIDYCLKTFRPQVEAFINGNEIDPEVEAELTSGFVAECINRGICDPTAV